MCVSACVRSYMSAKITMATKISSIYVYHLTRTCKYACRMMDEENCIKFVDQQS